MTRDEAKQLLPIIQAYANGEAIEFQIDGQWSEIRPPIKFDWDPEQYRVKPKTDESAE